MPWQVVVLLVVWAALGATCFVVGIQAPAAAHLRRREAEFYREMNEIQMTNVACQALRCVDVELLDDQTAAIVRDAVAFCDARQAARYG